MAGTPYLLDSNILLRWVKPDHNDYPLVVSAIASLKKSSDCFPTAWRCMKSGGNYLSRMGYLAFRSTMHGWPLRCEYMTLNVF